MAEWVRFIPNTNVTPMVLGEVVGEGTDWYHLVQVSKHPKFAIGTQYYCVPKKDCVSYMGHPVWKEPLEELRYRVAKWLQATP